MIKKYLIIPWFLVLNLYLFGQTNITNSKIEELELQVLIRNEVGNLNSFDLTGIEGCNKTEIKYLGVIKSNNGDFYKILNSFYVFKTNEDTCHGNSQVKIYDINNNYIGNYDMSMPCNLPHAIHNNKLVFDPSNCDCKTKNILDLNNGLPEHFFLECSNGLGDIFYLSK